MRHPDHLLPSWALEPLSPHGLVSEHSLTASSLAELDAHYEDQASWGSLVESLRSIRRAIESGVTVHVDGQTLDDWSTFYEWAHGRYHALEDGYDAWIGNDEGR